MQVNCIFVDEETGEGLYTIQHDGESQDEYDKLFDFWDDTEKIFEYLKSNKAYLETEYFESETIDSIERKIARESFELSRLLDEDYGPGKKQKLESLFRPLKDHEYKLPPYQDTKAVIKNARDFPRPVLRIYAVRISENTFVISGGAIKLVHRMEDHPDTKQELYKLNKTKVFLKSLGFEDSEDFKLVI